MKEQKMTWCELSDYLCKHHEAVGVVVFKQHPNWTKAGKIYPEAERSYKVYGDNKFFYPNMISTSIWADALEGTDKGVRLDWYMFHENAEDRWQVDYCYILESD